MAFYMVVVCQVWKGEGDGKGGKTSDAESAKPQQQRLVRDPPELNGEPITGLPPQPPPGSRGLRAPAGPTLLGRRNAFI